MTRAEYSGIILKPRQRRRQYPRVGRAAMIRARCPGEPMIDFSIVIATLDAGSTLQRCLDSVWSQDHPSVEVVVMDGGSSDETVAVLERNADRIHYWRSERDRGIYQAWNRALDHVTGDWVLFLGASDRLAGPDVLGRIARALTSVDQDTRVAYGSLDVVDSSGRLERRVGAPWVEVRELVGVALPMGHPATFHRRSLFEDVGRFDESYRICGDYELLLRDVLTRDPVFLPGIVVTEMQAGGVSDDPGHEARLHIENHRAQLAHGLTTTPAWRTPHVLRARTRLFIRGRLGPVREAQIVRAYRRVSRRHTPEGGPG